MNGWHRLGWILLGLLVVAGAIHAPLHEPEANCGPMSLCSGAVMLMVAAVALVLLEANTILERISLELVVVRRQPWNGALRGRAPPL